MRKKNNNAEGRDGTPRDGTPREIEDSGVKIVHNETPTIDRNKGQENFV